MMEEPGDRLRKARIRAGFAQANEAAAAYGWNKNTYKSHENGNRGISRKAAERYGPTLNVPVGWLLTGENPPDWAQQHRIEASHEIPVRRVPVLTIKQAYGLTQGVELEQNVNSGVHADYTIVVADPMLSPRIFALLISDPSMAPEFRPHEYVIIDPEQTLQPGDFVAAALQAGQAVLIRQLHQNGYDPQGREQFTLHALNPNFADTPFVKGDTGWLLGKVVLHTRKF